MAKYNNAKNAIGKTLIAFLPFGIIILILIFVGPKLMEAIKKIGSSFQDMIAGIGTGGAENQSKKNETEDALNEAAKGEKPVASGKGTFKVLPSHRITADAIFDAVNSLGLKPVGSAIDSLFTGNNYIKASDVSKIKKQFEAQKYSSDIAAVIAAYGNRVAKNRQSVHFGFVWDDTKGNLESHIERYVSPQHPDKAYLMKRIKQAKSGYL